MQVAFTAQEYQADGSIRTTPYAYDGTTADGWAVTREGRDHLRLGPGYRLLRVSHCGVCSTDLARRHLPFPLPQVTGHEVVAQDEHGQPVVVEINASHAARALPPAAWCSFCRHDLDTHCPERLVLGIHDLPGGFSPWLLAPIAAVLPVPAAVPPLTAMLTEPFAAALHAVETLALRDGDRVAVLGPRRLGALIIAALAGWRRRTGRRIEIVALARREELRQLARDLGADQATAIPNVGDGARFEVVIDTTGSTDGLAIALGLATREVHVKSTTGQPTLGLTHLTEMVVDEIALVGWSALAEHPVSATVPPARQAALLGDVPATVERTFGQRGIHVARGDAAGVLADELARTDFGAADVAVVTSLAGVDAAVRPRPGTERGLVRARGTIAVADTGQPRDPVLSALLDRGVRLSTSRCGDLGAALALLADADVDLGARMVTDRIDATQLDTAFARAADPHAIKVGVAHAGGLW